VLTSPPATSSVLSGRHVCLGAGLGDAAGSGAVVGRSTGAQLALISPGSTFKVQWTRRCTVDGPRTDLLEASDDDAMRHAPWHRIARAQLAGACSRAWDGGPRAPARAAGRCTADRGGGARSDSSPRPYEGDTPIRVCVLAGHPLTQLSTRASPSYERDTLIRQQVYA
jgi:hypothetical protein